MMINVKLYGARKFLVFQWLRQKKCLGTTGLVVNVLAWYTVVRRIDRHKPLQDHKIETF
jgi:hypothetical protein